MVAINRASIEQVYRSWTPVAKGISIALISSYLLQLVIPSSVEFLGLVAGKTIPYRLWNVLTSGFTQDSFFNLLVYIPALLFLSRTVEPTQGEREFIKFIFFSITASGIATFFTVTILYFIMVVVGSGGALADTAADILYTPICGFQGGIASLLVGMKHANPDSEYLLFSSFTARSRDFPGIFIIFSSILALITGSIINIVPFVVFGTYFAWVYLRFLHTSPQGFKGDTSLEFRFASFFPTAVQPPVDVFAAACSKATGLIVAKVGESITQNGHHHTSSDSSGSLPTSSSANVVEAARRRERGARALEERLGGKLIGLRAHPIITGEQRTGSGGQGLASVLDELESGGAKSEVMTTSP